MKKLQVKKEELNFKKFHISKINNLQLITGGKRNLNIGGSEEDDPIKTTPTVGDQG